ncbi:MAG: 30S ribosomal protein S6 [Sedimentisphaerales bacterium]|nr:30S ribosomal protein S6 [Sedimentisphaerales bacterium]
MTQESKRLYEGLFLADPAAATADWDGVLGAIRRILDRAEADVVSMNKWDDRRLCYDIAGRKRGVYILAYFNAPPDRIQGIERDVQLHEILLRVMILRGDRIPPEIRESPAPQLSGEKQEGSADRPAADGRPDAQDKPSRPGRPPKLDADREASGPDDEDRQAAVAPPREDSPD